MITFTELGTYGRLGNQLFQYAALYAASLRNGYVCKIPNIQQKIWHGQQCILPCFNISAQYITENELSSIRGTIVENSKTYGEYSPVLENIPDNVNIKGFFQNTGYFKGYENVIIDELTPRSNFIEKEKKKLQSLVGDPANVVSLHIRRGDMVDGTNPFYEKFYGSGPFDKNSVVGKYITDAIDVFSGNTALKFLVFVGGSRTGNDSDDIKWAKEHFNDSKFVVNNTNNPLTDFIRISLCGSNIISASSTYSWWAAYINKNSEKTVVCPTNYHLDDSISVKEGFYPKAWKQI